MPTLVDADDTPPIPSAAAADSEDVTMTDAAGTTGKGGGDSTVKEPPATVPSSATKSVKSGGKRRSSSPPNTANSSDVASAAASASQAIIAANLAAAVQMAASLQLNGLLSLLTQSSTPGVSASVADPTVLQTSSLSASLSASTASWQIPSPEQAKQAALKAVQDTPPFVHLSKADSAPQLKIIDSDRLTLKGAMRGYRMSRATHGVSQGYYYYEILVLDPPSIQEIVASLPPNARLGPTLQKQIQQALEYEVKYPQQSEDAKMEDATEEDDRKRPAESEVSPSTGNKKSKTASQQPPRPPQVGGHLRVGWSMRTGDLQAPVGYDKWSYGFRNLSGSKIHQSRREDSWGGEAWGPGDVIGCAIFLEGTTSPTGATCTVASTTAGTAAGIAADDVGSPYSSNNNNHIRFFKNGAPMGHFFVTKGKREGGAAFEGIQSGTYYPAISSYLGGSVQVNFGPHFVHPPRRLPHGMSGKLQPVSSLQAPPLTEEELMSRLTKKKNIFSKVAKEKETPESKYQSFKDAVLAESKVLQDAYQQHRRKHLQHVLKARQARNLNTADLRQELDEMDGKTEKKEDTDDKESTKEKATDETKEKVGKEEGVGKDGMHEPAKEEAKQPAPAGDGDGTDTKEEKEEGKAD